MKKNYSVETKKAIFNNGTQVTDFIFDNVFQTKNGIVPINYKEISISSSGLIEVKNEENIWSVLTTNL